ncbi:SYF2 splicing factor-domain-containing protein [Obelidium mucronatum]|nr:SYF2 splicing factor-domain-containing protein [Obelidium mucronatum]
MDARLQKLEALKKQRESSLKDNKTDVRKEFERSKRNHKEEIRNTKLKREAEILEQKLKAEEEGVDYERVRAMTYSVESVERYEKKERAKEKRKDIDFTDYAQVAAKKYKSLTKALEPDMNKYHEQKLVGAIADVAAGTAVVGVSGSITTTDPNSLAYAAIGNKPSQESIMKLVKDVEKQNEKRKEFSKRKAHNPDEDVTYINERNMRFNKKISRAYDKHTAEIKAAFERGTAL